MAWKWFICIFYSWKSRMNPHHHHQSLKHEGRWGTTDDFATRFLRFSLFSTALWDLPNSRPVHFLKLSSHLFVCPLCLLPPFTVPCKMVLAWPDERETWPVPSQGKANCDRVVLPAFINPYSTCTQMIFLESGITCTWLIYICFTAVQTGSSSSSSFFFFLGLLFSFSFFADFISMIGGFPTF